MPPAPDESQQELESTEATVSIRKPQDSSDLLTKLEVKTIRVRLGTLVEEEPYDFVKVARQQFNKLSSQNTSAAVSRREAAVAVGGADALDSLLAPAFWPLLPSKVELSRYRLVRSNRSYFQRDMAGIWTAIGLKTEIERHLRGAGCQPRIPRKSTCALSQVEAALELIAAKYSVATMAHLPTTVSISDSPRAVAPPFEVLYSRADDKYYWKSDVSKEWEPLMKQTLQDIAACRGISPTREEGSDTSAFARLIHSIHAGRTLDFVGELSGYPTGVHQVPVDASHTMRVLCPRGVCLPAAQPGEFPVIRRVIDAVLNHDEHGAAQVETVHLFLAEARQAIMDQKRARQAPAIGLIGVKTSGKSLLQNAILTPLLGGRVALAYPYLAGKTDKNGDMAKVEILHCEDSSIRYTFEERSAFGQSIKEVVGNQMQRVRAMYREATAQQPIWRIIITANSENNYWRILPPLDATLEGKLSLLFAATAAKTKALVAKLGGSDALATRIAQELPAYAHFLDTLVVSEERSDARHHYTAFIHPFLRDLLQEERPEFALLELMQARFFSGPKGRPWTGNATDIIQKLSSSSDSAITLQSGVGKTFDKLVGRGPNQLGRLLTDLVENSGGVVTTKQERVTGGSPRKVYIVQPPSEAQWTALRHLRPSDFEATEDLEVDFREADEDEVLRDRPLPQPAARRSQSSKQRRHPGED